MNHRERVLSALQRKGYDRLPVRHLGEPPVNRALMEHFGETAGAGVDHVANIGQRLAEEELDLLQRIGDDLRYVQPRYCGPAPRTFADGSRELAYPDRGWPVPTRYKDVSYGQGVYTEAVWRPFESVTSVQELDAFEFPTADWLDYANLEQDCERWDEYAIATGTPGVLDFINGISHSRGLERLFIDIGTEDPVYLKLMEKKLAYHYESTERVLKAAKGRIDIVQTGEDFASQRGPLISSRHFDRLLAPRFREFFEMVHRHGARVMMHVCGSPRLFIPRLIELGLDVLDVVQTSAAGMDIAELQHEFGRDLAFCGTMDVQKMLPEATPAEVEREVQHRRELFAEGGLILGPTHLIQPDSPLENILAMYRAAGSLFDKAY